MLPSEMIAEVKAKIAAEKTAMNKKLRRYQDYAVPIPAVVYRSATGFPYQLKPAVNEFLHKNRVSKADFLHIFGVRGKKISPGGDKSAIKIGDKLMKQEAKKQFITCL